MKKKDLKSLRTKDIKELKKMVETKRSEAANSHVKRLAGQEKNLKKVKNLRREIAQLLTIIKEKELTEEVAEKETKTKKETKSEEKTK